MLLPIKDIKYKYDWIEGMIEKYGKNAEGCMEISQEYKYWSYDSR